MKAIVILLFFTAFLYSSTLAQDDEINVEVQLPGDEEVAALEAELGEQGISEAIVQLPTIPQGIDNSVPWECVPRMWYRNSCQACKCNRRRQLRCVRLNCD